MTPKICECKKQGRCIDSRQFPDHIMRRYRCECGALWSSVELKLADGDWHRDVVHVLAQKYATLDRENVADRLIELAQELLR